MALQYLFDPNKQFQSLGGVNEVGGFLRVFLNGTDDRATTYKNFDGTLNEADIVLDSYGRAVVIVDDTKTYRIEVYNRLGGLMWTVSNYKARGGSGGGSGTPVSVEGTVGEIDVDENTEGGVKHFVVSLASNIKNAIATLTMAVNGVANALNGKKDKQTPVNELGATTKTLVGISQDSDGVMTVEFDDIAFPDWTSAINAAVATCEKLENKKTTLTGYERSNTYYPTIKAVVDFVNGMLQNLGGKLITDNGDPFTDSSDLPSSTPYGGVDIADKDYAYVQGVGTAERWSATVSGSSVAWVQEYAIRIPVFTPAQQAAIDSGATSTKVGNYDAHLADTNNPHGVTAAQVGALTPTGNGSNVTATFTAAGSRVNISTGEKLSVIFGKIAKWFTDLKALAFKDKVSDSDISGTIEDTHIASASTWNGKQNALPTTGTPTNTFAINVSGTSRYSENVLPYYVTSDKNKSWLEIGTYKADNSDEMYSGITFAVKFRSVDSHTQSGFVWISVGEWKSGGVYSNADIVCEYYMLGRRELDRSDSVKLYVNILGASVTDGVKIYAYLAGYSNISLTPLNVNKGTYTSSMTYLNEEPATKKEVTYCNLLRSAYGTSVGSSSVPVYVDTNGTLMPCSLPSSVQTWVGEVYSSATCEYSGGVYRFRGNLALNHGWGDSAHGYINYQMIVTRGARKNKNCACAFRLTPHYSDGAGFSFKTVYSQFVDSPSVYVDECQLHESGIGPCGTGSGRTIPTSLDYDIGVEASDWNVGETVNISLYATAVKQ